MKLLVLAAVLTVLFTAAVTGAAPSPNLAVGVTGKGKIVSSPAGVRCPGKCRAAFRAGSKVTLTAAPTTGWRFVTWIGACRSTRRVCVLRMTTPRSVRAVFAKVSVPPPPVPPSPAVGTRANPVPIGQVANIGPNWRITITSTLPDATAAVMGANQFNDPPAAGHQFFMASGNITYLGAGTSRLFLSLDFQAVGASNVAYGHSLSDYCGVLPDPDIENDSRDLFTGGTISGNFACWSVPNSDAGSLEMIASADSGASVFFALH